MGAVGGGLGRWLVLRSRYSYWDDDPDPVRVAIIRSHLLPPDDRERERAREKEQSSRVGPRVTDNKCEHGRGPNRILSLQQAAWSFYSDVVRANRRPLGLYLKPLSLLMVCTPLALSSSCNPHDGGCRWMVSRDRGTVLQCFVNRRCSTRSWWSGDEVQQQQQTRILRRGIPSRDSWVHCPCRVCLGMQSDLEEGRFWEMSNQTYR